MAGGKLPTSGSKLSVSTDGITYTDVGGIKDVGEISIVSAEVDATDKDDAGWDSHIVGSKKAASSFSGNRLSTDSGQNIIYTAAAAPSQIYFRYRGKVGTGEEEWFGLASCTFKTGSPGNNNVIQFSGDIRFTGAVTHQAQS